MHFRNTICVALAAVLALSFPVSCYASAVPYSSCGSVIGYVEESLPDSGRSRPDRERLFGTGILSLAREAQRQAVAASCSLEAEGRGAGGAFAGGVGLAPALVEASYHLARYLIAPTPAYADEVDSDSSAPDASDDAVDPVVDVPQLPEPPKEPDEPLHDGTADLPPASLGAPDIDEEPNEDDGTIDAFGSGWGGSISGGNGSTSSWGGRGGTFKANILGIEIFSASGRSGWGDSRNNLFSSQLYDALSAHLLAIVVDALVADNGVPAGPSLASINNRLVYNNNSAAWLLYQIKQYSAYNGDATKWVGDYLQGWILPWIKYGVQDLEYGNWKAGLLLYNIQTYAMNITGNTNAITAYNKTIMDRLKYDNKSAGWYLYSINFYVEKIRNVLLDVRNNASNLQTLMFNLLDDANKIYSELHHDSSSAADLLYSSNVHLRNIYSMMNYENRGVGYYAYDIDLKIGKLIDAVRNLNTTSADLKPTNDLISSIGVYMQHLFVDGSTGSIYLSDIRDFLESVDGTLSGDGSSSATFFDVLKSVADAIGKWGEGGIEVKGLDLKLDSIVDKLELGAAQIDYTDYLSKIVFNLEDARSSSLRAYLGLKLDDVNGSLLALLSTLNDIGADGSFRKWLDARLASLNGIVSGDVNIGDIVVDLSGIESKLDSILRYLVIDSAVDNANDFADLVIGDLNFSGLSASAGDVGTMLESAFPFCIPAMLKQVLGLLEAPAAPPVFDMEIMGASMHLDFDAEGLGSSLAQFTRWFSCVALVVMLLAGTRRFLFSVGGGGSSD